MWVICLLQLCVIIPTRHFNDALQNQCLTLLCLVSLVSFKSRKLLIKDVRKFESLIVWQRGLWGRGTICIYRCQWVSWASWAEGWQQEWVIKGKSQKEWLRDSLLASDETQQRCRRRSPIIDQLTYCFCIASAWVNNTNKDEFYMKYLIYCEFFFMDY